MSETKSIAFFIQCETGCSCCSQENHITGPYRSLKYAQRLILEYISAKRLASQYSKTGRYTILWEEAEILPDGRIIIEDRIFGGFSDDPNYHNYNEDIKECCWTIGNALPEESKWGKALPDWYQDSEDK